MKGPHRQYLLQTPRVAAEEVVVSSDMPRPYAQRVDIGTCGPTLNLT